MSFNNIKFTTKGKNLHAKVQAGAALNFTRIAIGDTDNGGASSDAYDNLLNPLHNITITKLKSTSDGSAIVGGVFNNSGLAAFYFREIGLFATDPDLGEILYCYGNAGATGEYIPEGGGSTILERQLDIVAVIGNTTTLTANIDYSMYSTMQFVQEQVASHNINAAAHADIRTQINNLTPHLSDLITDADGAHGLKIEEGTFTPIILATVEPTTYNYQNGYYYKIGKAVNYFIFVGITTKAVGMSGTVKIGGLPFTVSGNMPHAGCSISELSGLNYYTANEVLAQVLPATNSIRIILSSSASVVEVGILDLDDGFYISLSGTYLTN